MKPFYVYMLECADGSYYIGHTDDIDQRVLQHEAGEIGYTARRKPVRLMWQGEFETREGALAFEQQVKGWSRAKKEALVAGDWERIKELARSKSTTVRAEPAPVRAAPPAPVRAELVEAAGHGPSTSSGRTEGSAGPSTSSGRTEGRLADQVLAGQRRAIAKAITLIESTRADHRAQADELLTRLLPASGKSFRLGISGVPGVGKSTFIEALGLYLIAQGHRVAVLAVDPSSSVSGGSILGDKTRMEHLSVNENAYIRPSPSSGTLGGVAEKTREAMLVCEAAGYDIVIVETVGVGQSETAVSGMTDMFVLLQLPNAGDDLQAIKKGVMELADLVVINKADIDPDAATRAQAQIASALRIFSQQGRVRDTSAQVIQLSALKAQGLDRFWQAVTQFREARAQSGQLAARRQHQALAWMWERIDAGLKHDFREQPAVRALLPQLTHEVETGRLPASAAARQLLHAWRNK